MIFIGIDPGLSGGISALSADGAVRSTVKMPATERDVFDAVSSIAMAGPCWATIERVASSPQMGVTSAFTFGKGYGALLMCLTALGVPLNEVTPLKWQTVLSCRTQGDKNVSKRKAQQLFPAVKVTHSIADSLLIAEYGRRLHG